MATIRPSYKLKSWRDNLMDASFRGIPFKVEGHKYTCGRWVDVTELNNPNGQSLIWIVDKGGEAEYFDIDAYVIQNGDNGYDYFKNRDDLINALRVGRNMDNSGTLSHPYLGIKKAFAVGDQSFEENVGEGGICKIKMRFVWDTRQQVTPLVMANPSVADIAALNAKNAALDISANVTGGLNQDSLLGSIYSGLVFINSMFSKVKNAVSSVVAEAQGLVAGFFSTLDSMIATPCAVMDMFDQTTSQFETICGLGADGIEKRVYGGCSGAEKGDGVVLDGSSVPEDLGDSVVSGLAAIISTAPSLTGLPASQILNATLMLEGANLMCAASAAKILVRTEYASRQKFQDSIKNFSAAISDLRDRLSESESTTDLYQAAEDLRVGFFNAAQSRLASMNMQVEYTVPRGATTTTLTLAYNRYQDIDRAGEIQTINKNVRHPGFLPQNERMFINNV